MIPGKPHPIKNSSNEIARKDRTSRRLNMRKRIVNRFRRNKERRIAQNTQNGGEVIPEFYYPGTL